MSKNLSSAFNLSIVVTHNNVLDLGTIKLPFTNDYNVSLTNGTGSGQADLFFQDQRTLADGANEVLDVNGASDLTDAFGVGIALADLKVLFIKNNSADATLLIGGGTTPLGICNDDTDIIKIAPGGHYLWYDPVGLDVSTNKNFKAEHDGTGSSALDYDVIMVGTSA